MNLYGKAGGTQANPIRFLADPGVVVNHVSSTGVNASLADINVESAGGWYVIKGFHISSDGSAQRAGIRVTGSSNTQVLNNAVDHAFIGIFTSNSDGNITGIRFYKGPQNTGTHVGDLWSSTGTKLASATFANESGS